MYKKALILCLVASLLLTIPAAMSAADDVEPDITRAEEKWTILVYMNGDCSLESEMIGDFNELEMVGSGDDLDIIVQLDRHGDHNTSNGDWTDTRRYRILPDDHPVDMNSERLDSPPLGELEMGDPETMADFIRFGIENYPADHYLISLGGHSTGVTGSICPDDTIPSSKMSLDEFGFAFREVVDEVLDRPVDVLALDVCWMGMAEAAAEIKDHAKYFVGAFDETPGTGWPYDLCVPPLLDSTKTMEQRLTGVVDAFVGAYDVDFVSLSAVDVEAFRDQFMPAWVDLSEEMFYTAYDSRMIYSAAASNADKPRAKDDMVDVYHFAKLLTTNSKLDLRVRAYTEELLSTEDAVIIHSGSGALHPVESAVFGVHFTQGSVYQDYVETSFAKLTAWDDFLSVQTTEADLRPVRVNWTSDPPSDIDFELRTKTPALVSSVEVEIRDVSSTYDVTLTGSGGLFRGSYDAGSLDGFDYRYLITTVYGDHISFPPDGFDRVEFRAETDPPEVWHRVPYVINAASVSSGITIYSKDSTGVDLSTSVLYYRDVESTSWYSIPLWKVGYESFRGWIKTTASPDWIDSGSTFNYHLVINDTLGNSARYPASGEWTSVLGSGNRFYIDGYHSDLTGYSMLIDKINATGVVQDVYNSDLIEGSLTGYKAYVLVSPDTPLATDDVDMIVDFIDNGGEMLLIIDPADGTQIVAARFLLEALDIDTVLGSFNDLYPQNPGSELGGNLPSVSGNSGGSFEVDNTSVPVYYTNLPRVAMGTKWLGDGRIVFSLSDLFNNGVMGRSSNLQLAAMVTDYLSVNFEPVLYHVIEPPTVVEVGSIMTIDMSDSYDTDGEIVTYSALISGNTYSEGPNPVIEYTFSQSGLFSVMLTVTDAEGAETSITISVRANRPPEDGMGISSTVVHAGEEVLFNYKGSDPDGDVVTVVWMFGDGAAKSGGVVSHIYRYKGTYTITMIAKDSAGLEITMEGHIQVINSDPVAVIDKDTISVNSKSPTFTGPLQVTLEVSEGDLVSVSGFLSSDADSSDGMNFTWDMGDDTLYNTMDIEHVFRDSGIHLINLTVDDGFGGYGFAELSVVVNNNPPIAYFKHERDGGKIVFNATDSVDDSWDISGFTYLWDFGDGSTTETTDPIVRHDYSFGGVFDVNLTVVDPEGDKGYHTVKVKAPGMRMIDWLIMIIVIFIVMGIIGAFLFVYLRNRMENEDKGLLELLGINDEQAEEEDDPGGFSRVRRSEPDEGRVRDFKRPKPGSNTSKSPGDRRRDPESRGRKRPVHGNHHHRERI